MKNPRAKSAITEMIFDPNCGELLRQVIYDSNLNPKIQIENYYEYIDSNGLVTDHPNQIFLARLIQSLDVYGASASYEYDDASCYPTQIIFEDGLVQQFEYDSEKKVLTHEFLDGNSTLQKRLTYDYDDFGNLISQTEYDGKDVNDTTEHIYNKFGEVIRTISADGVVAGKTYDDFGRIISEYTLADANDVAIDQPDLLCQENFAYDSNGLLVSHSKAIDTGVFTYNCPDERIYTNYQYDEYGRLAVIIEDVNKSALTTFYDYDRQNAIVRILHQGGKWIEFYYDGRGLLIEQIEGFGSSGINLTEYQYDENRNLTRQIDSDGTISDLQYDCFDRIQNHILPNKSYVNYQYNPSGQVICQTQYDINNNPLQQTVFEYDNFGRCRAMRQRETCGINSDTNDFVILYEYDFLDNLVRKTIKADNENNAISIDYHFDGKKRITEIIDGLSNIQRFSYDKDDNITAFTNTLNLPVNYIYDAFGRLIKTQMPDGSSKSFVYDSLKRCVKETLFDFNSTAVEQVRYEFDNKGNLNKKIVMLDPSSQAPADTLTDYITFITTTAKQGFVNRQ
ncbi:MAG: putative deoxyribonuclease RhsA [Planctomycetes bacterium ADurb.Bin401]|nr:MAG: putative deoxyribonuclease RhsA [Planctomycetes bacterium ADurb.Bin401]